jgi:hypothetical protein
MIIYSFYNLNFPQQTFKGENKSITRQFYGNNGFGFLRLFLQNSELTGHTLNSCKDYTHSVHYALNASQMLQLEWRIRNIR